MTLTPRPIDDDSAWADLRGLWDFSDGVTYLNHGSFGPPPRPVREARRTWIDAVERDPMDFFMRRLEGELQTATASVAEFVGASPDDLVLVENATAGMNVVAASVKFAAGDEVLLTDHEYGAVRRIWERAARRSGAVVTDAMLPFPPESDEQVVEAVCAAITERTKLLVVSHITSPTALILPVARLTEAAHAHGAAVCIDGPHAVAQLPLDLTALACDFYTASLHKWLCAPFGSGFLYVHPRMQGDVEPAVLSWGRLLPGLPQRWSEEFQWTGTRDPSAYLAAPAAIEFIRSAGLEAFRRRSHHLALEADRIIRGALEIPATLIEPRWQAGMSLIELPPGDAFPLREAIWERFRVEVPIVAFCDRRFVRVSCHLYNTRADLERLAGALRHLLR